MTYKAADIIRQPVGRIAKGKQADLTLIDLEKKWNIQTKDFSSKSKISPFGNFETTGRAIRTVVRGQTVYQLD